MAGAIEIVIEPRAHDIGGLEVRRVLPFRQRRTVGPFVFFDHMGPARFAPGQGIDVRPHPHIGLATITYLFDGAIMHRDSLGFAQKIVPGDVNWMTAGGGIVHSERTGPEERAAGHLLHGIQSWIALPLEAEETNPEFFHHPASSLPEMSEPGLTMRLIVGEAFGHKAPQKIYSPIFYLDAAMEAGASLALPADLGERAVYVASGAVESDGRSLEAMQMAVYSDDAPAEFKATETSRVMLLGGPTIDAPRTMWWNFVSSRPERIERAKADWKEDRFAKVPGETEFIPLPDA